MAETETLTIFLETRPRRDVGTSRDRLETETSRPRPQPYYVGLYFSFKLIPRTTLADQ